MVAEVGDLVIDVAPYREKRDLMYEGLTRIGYQCVKPQGAFYVFPRTPIEDDVAFVRLLAEEGVLTVPGSGFGMPGHIRISLTVDARDRGARAPRLRARLPEGAGLSMSMAHARHRAAPVADHGDPRHLRPARLSLITGIVGVASVVGAFLTGWPSIIAVILNYVKRSEVARDLARLALPLADPHVLVRPAVGGALRGVRGGHARPRPVDRVAAPGVVGIWFVYRIVRGWLRLIDRQPMYH